MNRITPFLWFDGQAEEAMNFYTSIFKDSKKGVIRRFGKGAPGPEGSGLCAAQATLVAATAASSRCLGGFTTPFYSII